MALMLSARILSQVTTTHISLIGLSFAVNGTLPYVDAGTAFPFVRILSEIWWTCM